MSILTTLMPYIKERKKGNASKLYIAFLFDGDELKEERRKMMAQHLQGAV